MKNHNDIYISLKTPYLATFWFSSYGTKCCWQITLQDSSNSSNLKKGKKKDQVNFSHVDKHQSFRKADAVVFGGHCRVC